MTAYNVVRMRVKPGRNEDYLAAHREIDRDTFAGMRSVAVIRARGDRDFCLIGEWDDIGSDRCGASDNDRNARPQPRDA